ncbi:hypothetical protein B7494_g1835 [Chlorociboria aeruginascens]|nr:hypothetical protein B7494_g1835 [Chlorociboria aeruginascens]
MARFPSFSKSWSSAFVSSLALLSTVIPSVQADDPVYIEGTDAQGVTRTLLDNRFPALYTGDFGDCMGGQSLLNVTAFDAAYYADNMTVLFHLAGTTNLQNEIIMMYISVYAYGENRFDLTFNPCNANLDSLCPMNRSVPIYGEAIIPVATSDVSGIPNIALSIPDFEGSATLRFFSNASQTEIGCFQAIMRNGASFSHPSAIGPVLGIFTAVALSASFATAIYGVGVPQIRTHYAHSLSVLVVFEVFQSIFFSGALSLNWPSVLPAFWSNFAWTAGMIHSSSIVKSVNSFVGVSGNSSQVGGAGSAVLNNNGGLQQQIYGRGLQTSEATVERSLVRRALNATTPSKSYNWAGIPVNPGLPIPGNWTGFAGTLSDIGIPAADAFLTGFLWLLILVVALVAATALFKWSLELFGARKWMKPDRLALFRSHWLGFIGLIVLRSMLIAFFMIMTLALFQFSYGGDGGIIAISAIIFLIFFVGISGIATYACFVRLRFGKYASSPDRIHFQSKKMMKVIPWYTTVWESKLAESARAKTSGSVPFFRLHHMDNDSERQSVHEDADYTKRFGWLSSRFRRTRWWYFSFWVVYQFVRACFIGGARANQEAQVIGIFVVEAIALIATIWINPFESSRNTALAVYMLGISKVATAGLSIAFLSRLNVARIPTTVIGIVIIVIQGFLVIGLLILIVLGAVSSYMSITRDREEFIPRNMAGIRMKYLDRIDDKAKDVPPPPPPAPEEPKEPYFNVSTVRRAPKIEDEDIDLVPDLANPAAASVYSLPNRASRSNITRVSVAAWRRDCVVSFLKTQKGASTIPNIYAVGSAYPSTAILDVNVRKACETIMQPEAPMALRLQSNLLFGVSRVYSQQCGYVLADTQAAQNSMRALLKVVRDHGLDPEAGRARPDQLILLDDPAFLPDMALPLFDFDLSDFNVHVLNASKRSSQSSLSPHDRSQPVSSAISLPGFNLGSGNSSSGQYQLPINDPFAESSARKQVEIAGNLVDDEAILFQDDDLFELDADGNLHDISTTQRERCQTANQGHPGSDSAASRRVRKEHEDALAGRANIPGFEDFNIMQFGDDEIPLPDAESFPVMSRALQPNVPRLLASEGHTLSQESSSVSAEAPAKRRKAKVPKVLKNDFTLEHRNADLLQWQHAYVANMAEEIKSKAKKKRKIEANKNAYIFVYGCGIQDVGNGKGGSQLPHPLQMFSGGELIARITGEQSLSPIAKRGVKRVSEDEDEEKSKTLSSL